MNASSQHLSSESDLWLHWKWHILCKNVCMTNTKSLILSHFYTPNGNGTLNSNHMPCCGYTCIVINKSEMNVWRVPTYTHFKYCLPRVLGYYLLQVSKKHEGEDRILWPGIAMNFSTMTLGIIMLWCKRHFEGILSIPGDCKVPYDWIDIVMGEKIKFSGKTCGYQAAASLI